MGSSAQASEGNDKTNINWQMDKGPYAGTSLERNYWDPNNPASQEQAGFVNRQMADIASKYSTKGADINQQLSDSGVSPTTGTIGAFNMAQRVDRPQATEQSAILNNQFNQNWTGEQNQYGRQGDYTQQLNDLAYKKAAAEQNAEFQSRENQLDRRNQNQLATTQGLTNLATGVGSAMLGPVPAAIAATKKTG